jgi:hypothetical protein
MSFQYSRTTAPYYYWVSSQFGAFIAYDGVSATVTPSDASSFVFEGTTYTRGDVEETVTTTSPFVGTSTSTYYSISNSASSGGGGGSGSTPSITTISPSNGSAWHSEGDTISFDVNTANFPSGTTQLNWAINNVTTSNSDFSSVTGTVNISNNTGTFSVVLSTDSLSESNESFKVTVSGTVSGTSLTKQSGTMNIVNVVDGGGGTTTNSDADERPTPIGSGTGYGLEIFNENQTLIISSKVDVVLNKQELSFAATATAGGTTQITIPNVTNTSQYAVGLFPSADPNGISSSFSGNTISITNQSSTDVAFNIEIFRLS